MKSLLAFSSMLLLVLLMAAPETAHAQFYLAPHVAANGAAPDKQGDRGALSIGVDAQWNIRTFERMSLVLNPNYDYYLLEIDGVSAHQFDVNGLLAFGKREAVLRPYLGLGLAMTSVSGEHVPAELEGKTNFGFNVILGSSFGAGPVRPFLQFRSTFGDHDLHVEDHPYPGSGFSAMGGIMFKLSRD